MKNKDSGLGYEITEKGTGPFDSFGLDDLDRWLRTGLEGYLLEGQGAWAFSPVAGSIAKHGYLTLGLRAIYEDMSAHQRALFRQAVANVLASLEPRERNIPLFENLLSLAGLLPVKEVLRVLPARIGNGFFGLTSNRKGESLFTLTLLSVTELADKAPGEDVVTCLHDLVGSKNFFDHAYAGYTLVALCTADPTGLVDHMDRLRLPLASMFAEFETDVDAKRYLAKRVLDAVGLQRIGDALDKLEYNNPACPAVASDDWLVAALFNGEPKLLDWREAEDRIIVFRPDRPTVEVDIKNQIPYRRSERQTGLSVELASSRRIEAQQTGYTAQEAQEAEGTWEAFRGSCRAVTAGVHP